MLLQSSTAGVINPNGIFRVVALWKNFAVTAAAAKIVAQAKTETTIFQQSVAGPFIVVVRILNKPPTARVAQAGIPEISIRNNPSPRVTSAG